MNGCSINIEDALRAYLGRNMLERPAFKAVLFDMDGVLYDSMPRHAKAWKSVCDEAGIEAVTEEFFAYEGRTGASTIDLLVRRQFGRPATEEEARRLYSERQSSLQKCLRLLLCRARRGLLPLWRSRACHRCW